MKVLSKFRKFLVASSGNISLAFALFLPAAAFGLGGAVDYAFYVKAKTKLQAAADSAALAMGPVCSKKAFAGEDALEHAFMRHFTMSAGNLKKMRVTIEDYDIYPRRGKNYIVAKIAAKMDTAFMRLFGIMSLDMTIDTGAACNGGGNKKEKLEVALVMDTSETMQMRRRPVKIGDVRQEVAFFIRELRRQRQGDVRLALLPFSQYVTVGTEYRNAWWIKVPEDKVECAPYSGPNCPPSARYKRLVWRGKVRLRDKNYTYDNNYRDNPVPGVMNIEYTRNPGLSDQARRQLQRQNCVPTKMLPLTDIFSGIFTILHHLRGLKSCGTDDMRLGLLWGYRLLSNMKPFEGEYDRPGNRVRKVMIVVTDGYTYSDKRDQQRIIDGICAKIKAPYDPRGRGNYGRKDIITIVLPGAGEFHRRQMERCANLGFYEVNSPQELHAAFDDIVWRLGTLPPRDGKTYLSH